MFYFNLYSFNLALCGEIVITCWMNRWCHFFQWKAIGGFILLMSKFCSLENIVFKEQASVGYLLFRSYTRPSLGICWLPGYPSKHQIFPPLNFSRTYFLYPWFNLWYMLSYQFRSYFVDVFFVFFFLYQVLSSFLAGTTWYACFSRYLAKDPLLSRC